ncbi:glycosyltransferase [Prochlorococcus sp. MIT 1300]|uniref:glycosyltransferase n=1 Tax=Prochlorococcus sp. MIT 1300 TaxID=3096218 RepID=UPI002A75ADEB|nr:glycosyltransferase [Prochlorococcus sp. MIT 1300]
MTALDLEQSEHRGIATYSKALISLLRNAGAEVWLLTQFDPPKKSSGLNRLPKITQEVIHSSKVLSQLSTGSKDRRVLFRGKIPFAQKLSKIPELMELIIEWIRRPRRYPKRKINKILINNLFDNPNLRNERLGYLKNVDGLLCARNIYKASLIATLLRNHTKVSIDLDGFDIFITTCPLSLKPFNVPVFIQTIHDVIPLEYDQHDDNGLQFGRRLQACLSSRRIYVSSSTAYKFRNQIDLPTFSNQRIKTQIPREAREEVLVQPPSLNFPKWLTSDSKVIADLKPVSYLLRDQGQLTPFKYLLFNSSVEARKNLLFLVKAYVESNVSKEGIRLCVTGKLKQDSYSKAVKEIVKNEKGILLTGYIDESTKLDLYLNAMALVSPSLVEGFGIPVLDAACLGMPAIVSSCDSHNEIQSILDFERYVHSIDTVNTREWATAIESVVGLSSNNHSPEKEREKRICRYAEKVCFFEQKFQEDLKKLIN